MENLKGNNSVILKETREISKLTFEWKKESQLFSSDYFLKNDTLQFAIMTEICQTIKYESGLLNKNCNSVCKMWFYFQIVALGGYLIVGFHAFQSIFVYLVIMESIIALLLILVFCICQSCFYRTLFCCCLPLSKLNALKKQKNSLEKYMRSNLKIFKARIQNGEWNISWVLSVLEIQEDIQDFEIEWVDNGSYKCFPRLLFLVKFEKVKKADSSNTKMDNNDLSDVSGIELKENTPLNSEPQLLRVNPARPNKKSENKIVA